MKTVVTIKGHPIIDIYESFDGSYWFVTDKAWKQDSLFHGKIHKNDQILFGYVRLSHCHDFAEFGYFSEAELTSLGRRIWKVHRRDWPFCPEVKVQDMAEEQRCVVNTGWGATPALSIIFKSLKGGGYKMEQFIQRKIDGYMRLFDEIKTATGDDDTARVMLGEIAKDIRMAQRRQDGSPNGDDPASERQIAYLKMLGVPVPEGLTRRQASGLIDAAKAEPESVVKVVKAPVRVP
jgi:hypothetical protein